MPTLMFADLESLRLALASGAVPSAIADTPAQAGFDAQGHLWLQPEGSVPRALATKLGRMGISIQGTSGAALNDRVTCWHELLPLQRSPTAAVPSSVLFAVMDGAQVPPLVAEMKRLGAGTIGVRWLDDGDKPAVLARDLPVSALLLVDKPPLYTLLLAQEGGPGAPLAFVEHHARAWIQLGYRHSVADQIRPAGGRMVLLSAPRNWTILDDQPIVSGPDVLPLPAGPIDDQTEAESPRLRLDVQLVPAPRSNDPAELWVLRARAAAQLRALAEQSDDALLGRLSLAVGHIGGQRVVVLRAQAGEQGPPVLVLDALAYRPYLRLRNLFVPCGLRLRPAPRRDILRGLLAGDAERLTWLEPREGGAFMIHSLPASAFRPLTSYVAYTRDHEPQRLMAEPATMQFALPAYAIRELRQPARRRIRSVPATDEPAAAIAPPDEVDPAAPGGWLQRLTQWFRRLPIPSPDAELMDGREPASATETTATANSPEPGNAWSERCRTLEGRILEAGSVPAAADRLVLWPELGTAYAALGRSADAALSWLNGLWEQDAPSATWAENWLRAEARPRDQAAEADLQRWLSGPPTELTVRAIAAFTVWAATQTTPPEALTQALDRVKQLFEQREAALPVRAAWLAHVALARLTHGDVVGLARTRDRLLERLYHHGLSIDLDVPPFLRFAGQDSGARAHEVRVWLARAREPVHHWIAERPVRSSTGPSRIVPDVVAALPDAQLQAFGFGTATRWTRAYADLILAWGHARLGDRAGCQQLLARARAILTPIDEAHAILVDGYAYRAQQALEGRAGEGPWPPELLARLEELRRREDSDRAQSEQKLVYKVNKLREFSRILDPTEKIQAYRDAVLRHQGDELQRTLAAARALTGRDQLARRFRDLLAAPGQALERETRVLEAALTVAPRIGQQFAEDVLARFVRILDGLTFAGRSGQAETEIGALERGLFVAAHFDQAETVTRLLSCFDRLVSAWRAHAGYEALADGPFLALVGQGLFGLRRLGLRDEVERLLQRLSDWLMPTPDLAALRGRRLSGWPTTLRRLLALASGWLWVGREARALPILDAARQLLFSHELPANEQTEIAVGYVEALGHAPPALALARVDEVFERLHGVTDSLLTKSHYSLAQLRLVEAAVLAVANDDFTHGSAVRRWLDDDEYLVRRRIHRDLRTALEAATM